MLAWYNTVEVFAKPNLSRPTAEGMVLWPARPLFELLLGLGLPFSNYLVQSGVMNAAIHPFTALQ